MSASSATADVSVVIPALNEAEYLPHLLESLATQTRPVREVFVVDADSRDGTRAAAEAGGAVCLAGGGRPGFSRDLGAERAVGEWLLFLDADLRLPPTAVEETLAEVAREGLDAMSCAFVPDSRGWLIRLQHRVSSEYFWITSKLRWPHSIGGFLFVRRSLHEAVGGFDHGIQVAEDQDYVRRLARAGRYAFTRRPVVEIAARRFDAEGLWVMSLKWIGIELHRLFLGEIRGGYFRYFK
ncbi:MAG TPA: glycosyltransferase [Longimicrobiales bacterium]|jgi:glycosyltransferase involved in cell wall biosynthesis